MAGEIIYECNSKNNRNVREGELNILRKYEEKLYFEFGESEENIKKRFYDELEVMNKDFETLEKMKAEAEAPKKEVSKKEIREAKVVADEEE